MKPRRSERAALLFLILKLRQSGMFEDETTGPDPSLGEGEFGEALRVSGEFIGVAIPLLLTAFEGRELMRAPAGALTAIYLKPPLQPNERKRLLGYLFELVERSEWERRCAVAREVTDERGARMELLLPIPPAAYQGGEALIGPFSDADAAREWASAVREPGLAFDTVLMRGGVLVDLFLMGGLLDGE